MKLTKKATAITPHLTVRDVAASAKFYESALGFTIKLMLPGGPEGKIMHAELSHGNSTIMLGPESISRGVKAPITSGSTPSVSIYLNVEEIDALHAQAVKTGAIELLPPSDQFFGARTSILCDPDGHQWMLAEHRQEVSESSMKTKITAARLGVKGQTTEHTPKAPAAPVRRPQRV
ncbi:MAG: glyoxalase/bleomycin resistance/extradiol dioxygenase family protein [Myxococcota bacterium]